LKIDLCGPLLMIESLLVFRLLMLDRLEYLLLMTII
jgi:hypothetical protein